MLWNKDFISGDIIDNNKEIDEIDGKPSFLFDIIFYGTFATIVIVACFFNILDTRVVLYMTAIGLLEVMVFTIYKKIKSKILAKMEEKKDNVFFNN